MTRRWLNNELWNYEYILMVNRLAGRSFHDFSQYPIFPWVIADYTSVTLDLELTTTFRDLSKPIGAVSDSKLLELKVKFEFSLNH